MARETRGEMEPTDLKLFTGKLKIHHDSDLSDHCTTQGPLTWRILKLLFCFGDTVWVLIKPVTVSFEPPGHASMHTSLMVESESVGFSPDTNVLAEDTIVTLSLYNPQLGF